MEVKYMQLKEPENAHEFHMLGSPRLTYLLKKQMEEMVPIVSECDEIDERTLLSIRELRQQTLKINPEDFEGKPTIDSFLGLSDAFALVNQMYARDLDRNDRGCSPHIRVSFPCIAYFKLKIGYFSNFILVIIQQIKFTKDTAERKSGAGAHQSWWLQFTNNSLRVRLSRIKVVYSNEVRPKDSNGVEVKPGMLIAHANLYVHDNF
jgi:hypothetical protein